MKTSNTLFFPSVCYIINYIAGRLNFSFCEERIWFCESIHFPILGLHSRDEADMLVYKTMAKCRSSFA